MKVKVTIDLDNNGKLISSAELDKIMRACVNGVMTLYRDRVETVGEAYQTGSFIPQMNKQKVIILVDEEPKDAA